MVIVSGTDPLRDEAMKSHEENEKAYEEAMKENKEAIDLVSGDETKKKDGKIKSSELKKMHLSESLFEDLFDEDEYEEDHSDEKLIDKVCDILNGSFTTISDQAEEIINLVRYWDQDVFPEEIEENADFFHESQHLDEDAGDDFLDKINKQILNVNENLELNEENDVKSAYDIANDIIEEYPKDVDIQNHTPTGSPDDYYKIEFLVDGDWKHDHLAFKYWMNNNAAEISGCEVKYGGETPIEESDDDVYKAVHTYFFIPEKQEIQEPEIEEPQQEEEENMEEIGFDDDSIVAESLKFQIAKEQLKRFNEGKMPKDWSPNKYLENLVKRNHLTEEQKNVLTEAFLK